MVTPLPDPCCINPLIKCCCQLAKEQVCDCLQVGELVEDLNRGLESLRTKREGALYRITYAEERGEVLTEEAAGWLERVNKEEKKVLAIQKQHAGLCKFVCATIISWKAVKLLAVLDELSRNLSSMTDLTRRPTTPAVTRVPNGANATDIDSRQIRRVLGFLRDDGVGVVGICGPGGVGKTALLWCINEHFYTESIPPLAPPLEAPAPSAGVDGEGGHLRFRYVIWLQVLADSTEASLRHEIAGRLDLTLEDAQAIFDFLSTGSFLLLLDGLHKPLDLSLIGIPRPSSIHKVVFTTRSRSLCGDMGAKATIRMQCLSPTDALALFQKNANVSASDAQGPLRRLIEKVAGECSGLPQAIVNVGRAMSQTRSFPDWDRAWTILHKANIKAIKLSQIKLIDDSIYGPYGYNSHGDNTAENKFFLSCSLWPGNSSINSEELVLLWIGLGLIDVDLHYRDVNDACDAGHQIVKKLKDECLLEPGESDQSQVRMLNPIRLNALHRLSSECSTTQNSWIVWSGLEMKRAPQEEKQWESAELVALVRSGVEELLPLSARCPNLRTLMLGGNPGLKAVPPSFLRFMPGLTYLDLSDTGLEEVPTDIDTLGELRYLNLSRTYIRELPKEIGSLVKLRYLLLYGTLHLKKIHHGVLSILPKLQLLDLTDSGYSYHLAETDASDAGGGGGSIGELRNIRSSTALGLTVASLSSQDQLRSLTSAPIWRMSIMNLEGLDFEVNLQLLSPNLLGKSNIRDNLREFTMKHSNSVKVLYMDAGHDSTEDGMKKLEILRLLSLSCLESISWSTRAEVRNSPFPSLRHLTISYCDKLREATWVAKLQLLEHLELSHCSHMESVLDVAIDTSNTGFEQYPLFGGLRTLVLEGLPELRSVCNQRLGFASLECLRVSGCPRLDRLLFRTEMSCAGKMQMIQGERVWWENLQWEPEDSCIKAFLQTVFVSTPPIPPSPPRGALPYFTGAHGRQADPPQPVGIRKIMVLFPSFYRALLFLVGFAPLKLLMSLQKLDH